LGAPRPGQGEDGGSRDLAGRQQHLVCTGGGDTSLEILFKPKNMNSFWTWR